MILDFMEAIHVTCDELIIVINWITLSAISCSRMKKILN